MFKQKTVFGLVLIAIMTLFLDSIAKAEGRTVFFEKGDAIYSDLGENSPFGSLGHAGLYWYWKDVRKDKDTGKTVPNDPDDLKTHKVIESNTDYVSRALLGYYTTPGVQEITFKEFYDVGDFWSVRTNPDLTWKQRSSIVNIAERQIGNKYHFFRGYKSPGRSFRCDGLVEYCYKQVGVDLIPGDTWSPDIALLPGRRLLTPHRQMHSSKFKKRDTAEVKEARIALFSTPKGYASDGDYGSGIALVEFWDGEPDDTPDSYEGTGIRFGWDSHPTEKGGYYECEFPHGFEIAKQGKIKVFDQAGNWKVGGGEFKMVDFITLQPTAGWGPLPTLQPTILYSKWGTVSIELVEKLQDRNFYRHTWRATHTPDCWAYPEVVVEPMDEQSVEFTKGICWDGICDDAPEGCVIFKTFEYNLYEEEVHGDGIRSVRELIESCDPCGWRTMLLHVFDTRTGISYGYFGGSGSSTYVPDVGATLHLARAGYDREVVMLPDTLVHTDPFWILRGAGGEYEQYVYGWIPESPDDYDCPPWSFHSSAW